MASSEIGQLVKRLKLPQPLPADEILDKARGVRAGAHFDAASRLVSSFDQISDKGSTDDLNKSFSEAWTEYCELISAPVKPTPDGIMERLHQHMEAMGSEGEELLDQMQQMMKGTKKR